MFWWIQWLIQPQSVNNIGTFVRYRLCSLLLVLLAGDHVALGHIERRRVAVGIGSVLEQHRVVVLRLQTHSEVRGWILFNSIVLAPQIKTLDSLYSTTSSNLWPLVLMRKNSLFAGNKDQEESGGWHPLSFDLTEEDETLWPERERERALTPWDVFMNPTVLMFLHILCMFLYSRFLSYVWGLLNLHLCFLLFWVQHFTLVQLRRRTFGTYVTAGSRKEKYTLI